MDAKDVESKTLHITGAKLQLMSLSQRCKIIGWLKSSGAAMGDKGETLWKRCFSWWE